MPALDNKNFDQEYNSSKAVKELFRVQVPMLTKKPQNVSGASVWTRFQKKSVNSIVEAYMIHLVTIIYIFSL